MSSEPTIRASHVSKVYDLGLSGRTDSVATIAKRRLRRPFGGGKPERERFQALDDVSFDVGQGQTVGFIGKNGAGKSTLLKILSRITPPSSGHIDMVGTVGSLLEVGTGFHPELTGRENVYLSGTILGMPKREIDRRLEEILAFAEVDRFLETPVKRYSSGMRVRLAFAVAAHLEPDVLIVDEVLSVGDYAFQAKCLDKMRTIASDQGRTVLYVSHNLVTVEHLCSRGLLLLDGRLVFDGTATDAIAEYLQLFPHGERSAQPGVFDLAATDREGTGYETVFRRVTLRPGGGAPTDSMRAGDSLHIDIDVEGFHDVEEPVLFVTFFASTSAPLFRTTSWMVPLRAAQARQRHETVSMVIPQLPLTPGDYSLEVQLKDGGRTVDFVAQAATFSIVSVDTYGAGFQFTPQDGYFQVPWEWEVRPTPDARVSNGSAGGSLAARPSGPGPGAA